MASASTQTLPFLPFGLDTRRIIPYCEEVHDHTTDCENRWADMEFLPTLLNSRKVKKLWKWLINVTLDKLLGLDDAIWENEIERESDGDEPNKGN